jgi:hypothetical protein
MDLFQSLDAFKQQLVAWLANAPANHPQRQAMLDLRAKVENAIQMLLTGELQGDAAALVQCATAVQGVTKQLTELGTDLATAQQVSNAIGSALAAIAAILPG